MRARVRVVLVTLAALATIRCGDDPAGPSGQSCGGVQGSAVEFCRQVAHYQAGFGVPGADVIHVTCIGGPSGATVSNAMNGTYSCGGTYKLTTFPTAEITLAWGGTTSYTDHQSATVRRGEGTFSVRVTKLSGGQGNLFLSMSSGSMWMFDTVPVNTLCGGGSSIVPTLLLHPPAAAPPSDELGPPGVIHRFVPRVYDLAGG